jgi:membrane protease YdiL (CAAX protease family)
MLYAHPMAVDGEIGQNTSRVAPDPTGGLPRPTLVRRVIALLEVVTCSGYPTQIALLAVLTALGFRALDGDAKLTIGFVAALELGDTAAVVALILLFLSASRERARALFLGARSVVEEALAGLPMILAALGLALAVLLTVRLLAPSLRTVPQNPLLDLIDTKGSALMFAVVVVVAGGVREELQRAFILHRFERWLGGARLGVVVGSIAFGLGHLMQGADAAIATACLGAFWGVVYLRRRSIVAPVVSHAGFNLLQLAQAFILRTDR